MTKNNYMTENKEISMQLTEYDTKVKTWKLSDIPIIPSERRKEVQELSKNIKEYQNLK